MPTAVTSERRALRAVTFATVLTGTAVLAHTLAGGMTPGVRVVAASALVLLAVGWLLAGRDRSPGLLAAVAAVGELALHVTFSLTMPGAMTMGSLLCGRPTAASRATDVVPIHVVSQDASATSHFMLIMMVAHAIAGVLVVLALRSAEAVVAAIAGLLSAVLLWALPAAAAPSMRRVRLVHRVRRLSSATLFVASPRRGPPVLACS